MTDPDPRVGLDPEHPGGLVEGGQADIPGVQDEGPADRESEQDLDAGGTAGAVPPADEG